MTDELKLPTDPDAQRCLKCGKDALDTGWECTECGYDNQKAGFTVPAPTLAALCRAWLAVDEAPVGEVVDSSWIGGVIYSVPPELDGQRVRIVPVEGDQ